MTPNFATLLDLMLTFTKTLLGHLPSLLLDPSLTVICNGNNVLRGRTAIISDQEGETIRLRMFDLTELNFIFLCLIQYRT